MSRALQIFLVLCLCVQVLGIAALPSRVYAQDTNADAIVDGLKSFAGVLDGLGGFEELGETIPFTALDPSDKDALNLGSLFGDVFSGLSTSNLDNLADDIASLGGDYYSDLTVTFSSINVSDGDEFVDVSFNMTATRSITVPVAFSQNSTNLTGGEIPIDLTLSTTLEFQLDKDKLCEAGSDTYLKSLAFYLVGEPTIDVGINANATIAGFPDQLGFTEITVDGTATMNIDIAVDFADPDSDGQITKDEWTNTSLLDLVVVEFMDEEGDAVNATLNLASDLLSGELDGTITLVDETLTDGLDSPEVDLGALESFTNVKADDVLIGVAQLAAGLAAAQISSDVKLPFLQESLGDAFSLVDPLVQFVQQQGEAAIVCGTEDTNPPTGDVSNLLEGATVYCQAIAIEKPTSVAWSINNGNVVANGTEVSTVGPDPTKNAVFKLTSAGSPQVKVEFTDADGKTHVVTPRFQTAQELKEKLLDIGEFDPVDIGYDPNLYSLTYHLVKNSNPDLIAANPDFGSQLRPDTNLVGLSPKSEDSATIDITNVALDITFGVILVDDIGDITPDDEDSSEMDRFFIQVGNGEEFKVDDAVISADVDLEGRLGFLEVSATGSAEANTANSMTAFEIVRIDNTAPMLAVNINPPTEGIPISSTTGIPDAVLIRNLLEDVEAYVDSDINIKMTAGLEVEAKMGNPPTTLASGNVAIVWADITDGSPIVTPSDDFNENLKVFDLAPTVTGVHDGASSASSLHDSTMDFSLLGEAALLNAPVRNTTDGSTGRIQSIIDAHTLECSLAGGPEIAENTFDNNWDPGDGYEIAGNPQILMRLIMNNLFDLAGRMDALTGDEVDNLDTGLPLIGLSPQDLLPQFADLRMAIGEIRTSAAPPASLQELEEVLESKLDIPASALTFELADLPNPNSSGGDTKHLVMYLYYGICTEDNSTAVACDPNDRLVPKKEIRLNLDLVPNKQDEENLPPLVATETNDTFQLEYASRVQLDMGIPLSRTLAADGAVVLDTSSVAVQTGVSTTEINISANVGPLLLSVGGSAAVAGNCTAMHITGAHTVTPISGNHTAADPSTTELTDEDTDFLALGVVVGSTITNTTKSASGTVTAVGEHTITCASGLSDDKCWEKDDAYELIGPSTKVLTDPDTNFVDLGVVVGSTITNTTKNASGTVTTVGEHIITCADGLSPEASWEQGNEYELIGPSTRVLTDLDADFLELGISVGDEVTNITDDVICTVVEVRDANTLICPLPDGLEWNQDDEYEIGGAATAKLDATFHMENTDYETFTIEDFVADLEASLDGPTTPNDCGAECCGDACARLSLAVEDGDTTRYLGDLRFSTNLGGTPTIVVTQALIDAIAEMRMDWTLLTLALEMLPDELEQELDGRVTDTQVPMVGAVLDAGADVPEALQAFVNEVRDTLGPSLVDITNTDDIISTIQTQVSAAAMAASLSLLDDIIVTVDCGEKDCTKVDNIDDLQVSFSIGKGSTDEPESAGVPFDIGLPGMTMYSDDPLDVNYNWTLLVSFGLSRSDGPYLDVDDTTAPELELGARAEFKTRTDSPANCDFDYGDDTPSELTGFSESRCVDGILGYLPTTFWDSNSDPSYLHLVTQLNLQSDGGRLSLAQLVAGTTDHQLKLAADAEVNLRFRTHTGDYEYGFPSIAGTFYLEASRGLNDTELTLTDPKFDNLYLDADTFCDVFLEPVADGIYEVFSPMMPVLDVLRTPVPILSDLSEKVGAGSITPLTLLLGGQLGMINSLVAFIGFLDEIEEISRSGLVPLGNDEAAGSFSVNGALAQLDPSEWGLPGGQSDITFTDQTGIIADADMGGGATVSSGIYIDKPPELSFPFLNDATEIANVLLGGDAVLVRFDAGQMTAFRSKTLSFPLIDSLYGTFGLMLSVTGRFAMGYSTRGLRLGITGESSATVGEILLDGIFIDDLDTNGVDVPELKTALTVSAWASLKGDFVVVSIEFALECGMDFIIELNLNDTVPDGKLYIEEVYDKLPNPICLFDVTAKIEWFLRAWVEAKVGIPHTPFKITKKWTLEYRPQPPLFDVDLLKCDPEDPNLADVVGSDLVLNMGSQTRRDARRILTTQTKENFIVRQLTAEGGVKRDGKSYTKVSITAFGAYEEELVPLGGIVKANGDSGNDVITLLPGADANDNIIPFTLSAGLYGGSGRDRLQGGDGDDIIYGGDGKDTIFGKGGSDELYGGGGNDAIDAGIGDDEVEGGSGNDRINGGPGADFLDGGSGDDVINGGPGLPESMGSDYPDLVDKGDTIIGGPGDDSLRGHFGNDWIYGDEEVACNASGSDGGMDEVDGGPGDDHIFGGGGNDKLAGALGNDFICGNGGDDFLVGDNLQLVTSLDGNDELHGGTGSDTLYGRGGHDILHGNAGEDEMYGDTGNDTMYGDGGDDYMEGNADVDTMHGDAGNDTMHGNDGKDEMYGDDDNDTMYGDADDDYMEGNAGDDVMRGGQQNDTMHGNTGNDEIFGDSGEDQMYGDDDNDKMRGGIGDDYMEGNGGSDTMYGDAGQDDMLGGSPTEGVSDAGDIMYGNAGQDVMAGDNALITRPGGEDSADGSVIRSVTLLDLDSTNTNVSGGDQMWGNDGNDDMYGQGSDDEMHGGAGDDYMEGNPGGDDMYGDAGQDDMLGGTSQTGSTYPDGGDTIYGGDDYDVILGDNGSIMRPEVGGGWQINSFNDAVTRNITLYDVGTTVDLSPDPSKSGNDTLYGEANDDIMYGQGGDDKMHGGAGDDYMEGNADVDTMHGDEGNDDMVGGTGRINYMECDTTGNIYYYDLPAGTNGRLDSGDIMHGDAGFDVMAGDNAIIVRTLVDGNWVSNTYNGGIQHERIILLDIDSTDGAQVSGNDTMFGDNNDDIMYGQGGEDEMHGGNHDDYMEGNAKSDEMYGDGGDDDMVGGTGRINDDGTEGAPGRTDMSTKQREVPLGAGNFTVPLGDTMYGGDGADVMLGDNGIITRPLNGGEWITLYYLLFTDTDGSSAPRHPTGDPGSRIEREVRMIDDTPGAVAGSDWMFGGAGDDDLYGQFDDTAGTIQPAIGDELFGEEGEDAMAGDQGVFVNRVVTTDTQHIAPKAPFIDDDIFIQNTLFRQFEQQQIAIGGNDRMRGGPGGDWMHGGAGDDLMNGDSGNDRLFGGDGDDDMWGGQHHDHLWGGWGDDYLDVKPRNKMMVGKGKKATEIPRDPEEWFAYGEPDNYQDIDYIYGGWDRDAMQANIADEGPVPGDRLMDWVGAYNIYYLCPGVYGEFVTTRAHSPDLITFLQQLAQGDGALDTATEETSGFREVAIVFPKEAKSNSHPPHPDNPGHFTCEE